MVDSRARPNAVKEKKKMKKQTNYWKREMLLCCASFYQSRYHSLAKHVIRLINVTQTFLKRIENHGTRCEWLYYILPPIKNL